MLFKKKLTEDKHISDKDLIKLAKKYLKVLKESEFLPENSKEMYEVIKKAGLRWNYTSTNQYQRQMLK